MGDPFRNAVDFHNAFLILSNYNEETRTCLQSDDYFGYAIGLGQNSTIASITCLSFSIELYIKSLLFQSKVVHGNKHDILQLFMLLKPEQRDEIISICINDCQEVSAVDFDICLGDISQAFIRWRYSYEECVGLSFRTGFANVFAKALKSYYLKHYKNRKNFTDFWI